MHSRWQTLLNISQSRKYCHSTSMQLLVLVASNLNCSTPIHMSRGWMPACRQRKTTAEISDSECLLKGSHGGSLGHQFQLLRKWLSRLQLKCMNLSCLSAEPRLNKIFHIRHENAPKLQIFGMPTFLSVTKLTSALMMHESVSSALPARLIRQEMNDIIKMYVVLENPPQEGWIDCLSTRAFIHILDPISEMLLLALSVLGMI